MAQQTTTTLVDDFDDTTTAQETISFVLNGYAYEVDLSTEHATALRADLATWVDHARRTGGRARRSPTSVSGSVWSVISIVPFVIAVLRYAVDVDGDVAGEPEDIALGDQVLQVLALAWVLAIGVSVYL